MGRASTVTCLGPPSGLAPALHSVPRMERRSPCVGSAVTHFCHLSPALRARCCLPCFLLPTRPCTLGTAQL